MEAIDLIALIEAETEARSVRLDTRIEDLGIDSLDFLDLILTIENEFGFKIPDSKYKEIKTVGDFVKFNNIAFSTVITTNYVPN